jgi:hypothetical protein
MTATALLVTIVTLTVSAIGQHTMSHDRANQGMGFDQDKTTHHFLLEKRGGTIVVMANDGSDATSIDNIRMHLKHISGAFANGDFSLPLFVHATEPPGVATMKERRAQMSFRYEEVAKGGKVVVQTDDPVALAAFHDFLRFQIREHKTGDPLTPR